MNAVWLDVPDEFLAERHRHGQDKKDELWDGVLHMVPQPSSRHVRIAFSIAKALEPIGARRGLVTYPDTIGLFDTDQNYRAPDTVLVRPEHTSERGVEGAELAVEVLSPNDESRQKFAFYAEVGVRELWLIAPSTRAIEVYTLTEARTYTRVLAVDGVLGSPLLGIRLVVVDGPVLHLIDGDHVSAI